LSRLLIAICVPTIIAGCTLPPDQRPATWAQPVKMAGVKRLYRVDDGLYRCANPENSVWPTIREQLGIRTVVCLERFSGDRNLPEGIEVVRLGIGPLLPDFRKLIDFVAKAIDTQKQPVLVYCLLGSDRSSWACATYRVVVQGWTPEEAIREMDYGGYGSNILGGRFRRYLSTPPH